MQQKQGSGLTTEVAAMIELARRHPDELAQLKKALTTADEESSTPPEDVWLPVDRFNRALQIGSLVLTPDGTRGRVVRFDRRSSRALIELERGGTRMLRLSRIELRRGRPRKESYSAA